MAQRGNQTRAGDVTGRMRQVQQAEHADEVRAGAERMAMVNPPAPSAPDGTVVDLTGDTSPGAGVRMMTLEEVVAEGDTEIPDIQTEATLDVDSLSDGRETPGMPTQTTRPEEPQPKMPSREPGTVRPGTPRDGAPTATAVAPKVAERPFKILRVNEDLEEVTIGKGNHYTFKQGQFYKVTPEVYDHLNEKGFVYH